MEDSKNIIVTIEYCLPKDEEPTDTIELVIYPYNTVFSNLKELLEENPEDIVAEYEELPETIRNYTIYSAKARLGFRDDNEITEEMLLNMDKNDDFNVIDIEWED